MDNDNFDLHVVGKYGKAITTTEARNFAKTAWPRICSILQEEGIEILTNVNLDAAGVKTNLPLDVFKGAGVK